jgi:hypothetical protein
MQGRPATRFPQPSHSGSLGDVHGRSVVEAKVGCCPPFPKWNFLLVRIGFQSNSALSRSSPIWLFLFPFFHQRGTREHEHSNRHASAALHEELFAQLVLPIPLDGSILLLGVALAISTAAPAGPHAQRLTVYTHAGHQPWDKSARGQVLFLNFHILFVENWDDLVI